MTFCCMAEWYTSYIHHIQYWHNNYFDIIISLWVCQVSVSGALDAVEVNQCCSLCMCMYIQCTANALLNTTYCHRFYKKKKAASYYCSVSSGSKVYKCTSFDKNCPVRLHVLQELLNQLYVLVYVTLLCKVCRSLCSMWRVVSWT